LKQRRVQIQQIVQQEPLLDASAIREDDDDDDDDDDQRDEPTRIGSWTTVAGPSIKIPMNANLRILEHNVKKQDDNNNSQHEKSVQQENDDDIDDDLDIAAAAATTSSRTGAAIELVPPLAPLLAVYYKPKWVLSVRSDPKLQRPCLDANTLPAQSPLLPDSHEGISGNSAMMHPVGRLDYDSSGLLLFSSSGALTQRILHPHFDLPKEYRVTVVGNVVLQQQLDVEPNNDDDNDNDGGEQKKQTMTSSLRERLARGVKTGEGVHVATLREETIVVQQDTHVVTRYLQDLRNGLPAEYNVTRLQEHGYLDDLDPTRTTCISTFSLVVTEGKHRMVRRMLANCGYPVLDLHRVRIGQIHLNSTTGISSGNSRDKSEQDEDKVILQPGEYRYLTPAEESWVQNKLLSTVKSSIESSSKTKKQPPSRRLTPDKKQAKWSSSRSDRDTAAKKKKNRPDKKKSNIRR
jgi:pseudouridine synthase